MLGFYISAAHKSSGKTTLSLGLSAALRQQGFRVQAFKKGPDYIDPIWLSHATQRACVNLDFYTSTRDEIQSSFERYRHDADVVLVEGNKGLYDGMDLEGRDCNAALAKFLNLPVVLVLDASGVTRGIAPLIKGYQVFDPDVQFLGVILNRVAGPRHEEKLRSAIERYTALPVLGAIPRQHEAMIEERHLGLRPANEDHASNEAIDKLANLVTQHVNLDLLLARAHNLAPVTKVDAGLPDVTKYRGLKIGIFQDAAFGFYYADDLARFNALGVELVGINALKDPSLPPVDALLIGGGFPETHMHALQKNTQLRRAVAAAFDVGMPMYAECGGLMYLSQKIVWGTDTADMVGVIPAATVMSDRPKGRGYIQLEVTDAHPWPFQTQASIKGHEFHYSELTSVSPSLTYAYRVKRGTGILPGADGVRLHNLLASYAHLRHTLQSPWIDAFLDFVLDCRRTCTYQVNPK